MLKREDFPAGMPKEHVDRLLAIQAQGRWPFTFPVLVMYAAFAAILFGAAQRYFDIAPWAWALLIPAMYGMAKVANFFKARDIQKLMVEFGQTCPKCHKPLHSDTWSMAKGRAEKDAIMQGYCPRCFEHVFPNVGQLVELGVAKSEARAEKR